MALRVAVTLSLLALCPSTSPQVGARRHDRPDAAYRALGEDPAFASVAAVVSGGRHLGSGVLISPRWIATAAHVVSHRVNGSTVSLAPDTIVVRFGSVIYRVTSVIIHPGYWVPDVPPTADPLLRKGVDVALLQLDRDVPVEPARLASGPVAPGTEVVIVGFGTSGDARTVVTAPVDAGEKRAGTNVVDQVGGRVGEREVPPFLLVGDFDGPDLPQLNLTGAPEPTDLEYLPVGGDSGGGVFARIDGDWFLVGLVATASININDGDPGLGIYGSAFYAMALDGLRGWIMGSATRRLGGTRLGSLMPG